MLTPAREGGLGRSTRDTTQDSTTVLFLDRDTDSRVPLKPVHFPMVNSSAVKELEQINWYLRFPFRSTHDK